MKTLIIAISLLSRPLLAEVILNDAAITTATFGSGDYALRLTQSIPDGRGLFFVSFNSLGNGFFEFNTFAGNTYSIAEEIRLYLPTQFARFDALYANSHTPLFSNAAPANWSLSIPVHTSRYIGYWDDRSFDNTPTANGNYGWVLLTNGTTGLVANSGATAVGGGIIVGTTTQVPEPSSAAFLCIGALAISRSRRKLCARRFHESNNA